MHKIDKSKYEEFHDGEKEFCRESGPLVTKKIDAPSAIAKAIAMSLATVATMAAVIMTPTFKFVPKVVDVVANTAIIETKIENTTENIIYTYNNVVYAVGATEINIYNLNGQIVANVQNDNLNIKYR